MIDIATRECVMRENHFSTRTGKIRGNQLVGTYELDRVNMYICILYTYIHIEKERERRNFHRSCENSLVYF